MIVPVAPLWQYGLPILIFTAALGELQADPVSAGGSENNGTAGIFSFGSNIFQTAETGSDTANVVITRSGGAADATLSLLFGDLLLPVSMDSTTASFGAGELSKTINFFDIIGSSPDFAELPEIHLQIVPLEPRIASVSPQPSESATLLMRLAPQILAPLADIETPAGKSVQLSVVATGAPRPSFQWLKNGFRLIDETNATLNVKALGAADAGAYAVVVSNSAGSMTSEATVTIDTSFPVTVLQAPTILQTPQNQVAPTGTNVSFQVQASGSDPLSYQWFKDGTKLTNSSAPSLILANVQPSDAGNYYVTVRNTFGTATSPFVTLEITQPPPPAPPNSNQFPDLLFQSDDAFLSGWTMDGCRLVSASYLVPDRIGDASWRCIGSADFNQDTQRDLLFQNINGMMAVWFMNGNRQTGAALINPSSPGDARWIVAGIGDFNRDGHPDLIFQHTDGTLAIWLLDGVQLISAVFLNPNRPEDSGFKLAATGDFDHDGNEDLVFQHADGTVAFWLLDGTSRKQTKTLSKPSTSDALWRIAGQTDLNHDGNPDLIFQQSGAGTLAVWYMNGTAVHEAHLLDPSNAFGTWKLIAK